MPSYNVLPYKISYPELRRNDFGERTRLMLMRPRHAVFAAVVDQSVSKTKPFFFGEYRHQVALDLYRIGIVGEPQFFGKAHNMRIHCDSLNHAVCVPQDHIRALATYAGNSHGFFHRLWDSSMEFFFHDFRGGKNIARLRAKKPALM